MSTPYRERILKPAVHCLRTALLFVCAASLGACGTEAGLPYFVDPGTDVSQTVDIVSETEDAEDLRDAEVGADVQPTDVRPDTEVGDSGELSPDAEPIDVPDAPDSADADADFDAVDFTGDDAPDATDTPSDLPSDAEEDSELGADVPDVPPDDIIDVPVDEVEVFEDVPADVPVDADVAEDVDVAADADVAGDTDVAADADVAADTDVATDADADAADADVDVELPEPEVLPPANLAELSGAPYLMWLTDDSVSVRWETTTASIGRVDFGPTSRMGTTIVEPSPRTTHEIRITGLPANNLNTYRISWNGRALPLETFWTAPEPGTGLPVKFLVWGDNQNGPENFSELIPYMQAYDAKFSFSVGDCVQNGTRGEFRDQLMTPISPLAVNVPFLVAAGNHERYSDSGAALFNEYFSQPGDEHCFGWRYDNLYMLFIDTELGLDGATGQRSCITRALQSEEARSALIQGVAFHKPPRIEFWFGGSLAFTEDMEAPWVREQLEPLLESLDVDVVFNGHNHLYAHTPETPGGIVWVTTGGAGGMLDSDDGGLFGWERVATWPQIATTISQYHYLEVEMRGNRLTIVARGINGSPFHTFSVVGD